MPLTAGSQIKDYHAVAGSEPDPDWYLALQDANEGTPANATIAVQAQDLYKSAYKAATEKTVSSGVLTVDQNSHKIQPQSGTSDDIDTISGMKADTFLVLFATDEGTDTLTFKHGTDNLSCFGAADIALSHGMVVCYYDGSVVYVTGGGGVSSQNDTVIGSNISLVEATIHNQTIAGLTANRQNIFPVPSAVGKEITINTLDGDADYEMIPIGAATVTLNGGSAATALYTHQQFIANESTTWVSTSLTNWQLKTDGRIPQRGRMVKTSDVTGNGATTWTNCAFQTVEEARGLIATTGASSQFRIRRVSAYNLLLAGEPGNAVALSAGEYFQARVDNGSGSAYGRWSWRAPNNNPSAMTVAGAWQTTVLAIDDVLVPEFREEAGNAGFNSGDPASGGGLFTVVEIL